MKVKLRSSIDSGFSLLETMVAISVAMIVMTMSIMVLVSAQSSSDKILSRQEVASNTRFALSRILKDVGSAQSLLRCTVWKSSELQVSYDTYIRRIENNGDDPNTSVVETGSPIFNGSSADCLEYYESGKVLLQALPNSICWYQDLTPSSDEVDYTKPFQVACLFRGGSGRSSNYNDSGFDQGFGSAPIAPLPCSAGTDKATNADMLYYLECSFSDANLHYFVPNESATGSWNYINDSYRQVLDLGEIDSELTRVRRNIFSFTNNYGSNPGFVDGIAGANTGDIIYVAINMDIAYLTKELDVNGAKKVKNYHYSQSVLLQGAKSYQDEGAYAGKFTG